MHDHKYFGGRYSNFIAAEVNAVEIPLGHLQQRILKGKIVAYITIFWSKVLFFKWIPKIRNLRRPFGLSHIFHKNGQSA